MNRGTRIAARIKKGIERAGTKTGNGPLFCTLRRAKTGAIIALAQPRPWDAEETAAANPSANADPYDYFSVTAVQEFKEIKDTSGTLVGKTQTVLMVAAGSVEPLKSDHIAVGVALAEVDNSTVFAKIADVKPLAPGGVALKYGVVLSD